MQIDNIIKQDLDNFYSILDNNNNNISKNLEK